MVRCYPIWLQSGNSLSCDISSLSSLFLAHVNADKERVFESCEIAHARERVKGWKHLTLISHLVEPKYALL